MSDLILDKDEELVDPWMEVIRLKKRIDELERMLAKQEALYESLVREGGAKVPPHDFDPDYIQRIKTKDYAADITQTANRASTSRGGAAKKVAY